MRKAYILLILVITNQYSYGQFEDGTAPTGQLRIDIFAVKKDGFNSIYMGQGILAFDLMISSENYDLRSTKSFGETTGPIQIVILCPGRLTNKSFTYIIPKTHNFFGRYFSHIVKRTALPYYVYKIEVPLIKLIDMEEIPTNKLTIKIDPNGAYAEENKRFGYIFEIQKNRQNNVIVEPMTNKITLLKPAEPVQQFPKQ